MQITQRQSPNQTPGRQGQTPDFIVCHITGASFQSAINTIMNRNNQVSYHFVVARDGTVIQAVDISNTAWANGTTNSGDNRDNQHSTIPEVRSRRRNANQFTISVGFADSTSGELSQAQLAVGVELIWHIRNEVLRLFGHTIPMARSRIVGHHEITPITRAFCPGPRFPWDGIIRLLQEKEQTNQPGVPVSPNISAPNTSGVIPGTSMPPAPSETLGTSTPSTTPQPSQRPSSWAADAWEWGQSLGLTDGTNPHGQPTREQMVTLLYRYHNATA